MRDCPGFLFEAVIMTKLKSMKCPRCRKEAEWEGNPSRPFCSDRCRLLDLGAWANEEYRVPGEKKHREEPEEE